MQKKTILLILSIIITTLLISSCNDDNISSNSSYKLRFSTDTVSFDTVFTTISSTTAKIKIYNPNSSKIKISYISLANSSNSVFKINVNGRTNESQIFTDIELDSKDSLYIFINVNIDYNNEDNPILFEDKISFSTNNNIQEISLQAVGQDAIILKNATIKSDSTLTIGKPYLIYGQLKVDSGKTLTIGPGVKMYFHKDAGLSVSGSLNAVGTLSEPIILRADRIDYIFDGVPYDSLPGQWKGISLTNPLSSNTIAFVELKNAINGITISGNTVNQASLRIENSKIHNCSQSGLVLKQAKSIINNSQISNCGDNCIYQLGGESQITHCTIANFFPRTDRNDVSVWITNYKSETELYPIINSSFNNCIIFGNYSKEISLDYEFNNQTVATSFDIEFNSCQISGNQSTEPYFKNTIWTSNKEVNFVNTTQYPYDYRLAANSPAINNADLSIANTLILDKNDVSRIANGKPDIGAYEWQNQ